MEMMLITSINTRKPLSSSLAIEFLTYYGWMFGDGPMEERLSTAFLPR